LGGEGRVEIPRKIGNRETEEKSVVIRGRSFTLLAPKFIEEYIDSEDPLHDFPLWAKVWEASWVLADFLAGLPADPEKRLLEIGCGLGLVGVVAASFGHKVVMTEHNPEAIAFARANAERNHCADMEIIDLDWNAPANFVKPFSDAMVKTEKGKFTPQPVQTQFGWHVIRVDDVRAAKVPSFDEVKPQLQQRMQSQWLDKYLRDLRAKNGV